MNSSCLCTLRARGEISRSLPRIRVFLVFEALARLRHQSIVPCVPLIHTRLLWLARLRLGGAFLGGLYGLRRKPTKFGLNCRLKRRPWNSRLVDIKTSLLEPVDNCE